MLLILAGTGDTGNRSSVPAFLRTGANRLPQFPCPPDPPLAISAKRDQRPTCEARINAEVPLTHTATGQQTVAHYFMPELEYYQVRSSSGTVFGNKYSSRKLAEQSIRLSCSRMPEDQQKRFIADCEVFQTRLFIYDQVEHL